MNGGYSRMVRSLWSSSKRPQSSMDLPMGRSTGSPLPLPRRSGGPKSNEAIVTPQHPRCTSEPGCDPGRSISHTDLGSPEGYFVTHYVVYIDGEVIVDDESAKVFTETTAIIEGLTNESCTLSPLPPSMTLERVLSPTRL